MDNDEKYNLDKYIESNGKFKYAYVVMVIDNDIYANPAIVFAESIRKVGSLAELVVMVDNNITAQTVDLLRKFYNKIIIVDKIQIANKDPIQKIILTKVNAFKLIEYEKIFLLDVDTILFSNIDNFFKSKTYLDTFFMLNKDNYGFIMISPDDTLYNNAISIINKNLYQLENEKKPFGFVLKKLFKKIKNMNISVSTNKYENNDGIQYTIDKPFLYSGNISIEERMRLDHFKVWFSFLSNIINKFPEIKEYKCLEESVKMSSFFLAGLSRFIVNFIKTNIEKKKNNVIGIYGKNNNKNLNFYHLDISRNYNSENINYNIETNDFKTFLQQIDLILLKSNSNSKIFTKYYQVSNCLELINLIKYDEIILNIFLSKYIKMCPNVFVSIEINNINNLPDKPIPDLKNNIIYSRIINLEKDTLINILFNLCHKYTYSQRLLSLGLINKDCKLKISIYETISKINSSDINVDFNTFLFYNTDSKIRISSIFFNSNTLKYFANEKYLNTIKSNSKNILQIDRLSLIKILYLQTLKKWVYNNYLGNHIENLIVLVSSKNKFIIIDNNQHKLVDVNKIRKNKIFIIDIIFSKFLESIEMLTDKNLENTDKNLENTDKNLENIDLNKIFDPNNYFEFEGLKIACIK